MGAPARPTHSPCDARVPRCLGGLDFATANMVGCLACLCVPVCARSPRGLSMFVFNDFSASANRIAEVFFYREAESGSKREARQSFMWCHCCGFISKRKCIVYICGYHFSNL